MLPLRSSNVPSRPACPCLDPSYPRSPTFFFLTPPTLHVKIQFPISQRPYPLPPRLPLSTMTEFPSTSAISANSRCPFPVLVCFFLFCDFFFLLTTSTDPSTQQPFVLSSVSLYRDHFFQLPHHKIPPILSPPSSYQPGVFYLCRRRFFDV